jgi:hypothetical protein
MAIVPMVEMKSLMFARYNGEMIALAKVNRNN